MKSLLPLFLCFPILTNCGDDSGEKVISAIAATSESKTETKPDISGKYALGCFEINGFYTKQYLELSGGNYKKEIYISLNESCLEPLMYKRYEATFSLGDKIPDLTNTYNLDVKITKSYLKLLSKDMVDEGNQNIAYGYSDWELNKEKEIQGKKSSPDSENEYIEGQNLLMIIKSENSTLTFGEYSDIDITIERPRFLETHSFNKQ